jgi:hypothetical protein
MSYALTFADARGDSESAAETAPAAEVWRRVVARVGPRLPGAEVTLTGSGGQLTDEATGIDLRLTASTGRIDLAYWHFEQPAQAIGMLYELAGIVEQETGLVGADPQLGMPVREAGQRLDLAASMYANVAAMFERQARTQARIAARRAERGPA